MKFNTLVFDANLPTVQQVNVPTNSDYKVGMKVKRNGEIQQLGPDEFTIYTGEINVIPPTQYTAITKECENAGAMQFLNLKDNDLSAVAGKRIKSTDIWVEFSFDNGTTWTKGIVDQYTVPVKINDRSSGSNNYIASTNLSNPAQWTLLDHNVATGEYADYVTVPDVPYIMIQFLGSNFTNITSYPCLWRLVFLYGGEEIPVTIPTDAEKTNGYVTFTQASNDNASFRQLSVVVDTRVPSDQEEKHTSGDSASQGSTFYAVYSLPAESAGKRIYADTVKVQYSYDQGSTWMDFEDFNGVGVTFRSQNGPVYGCFCKNVFGDTGKWHLQKTGGWETSPLDYVEIPGSGNPYMYLFYNTTNGMTPTPTQWPIKFRLSFKVGNPATGFTANFKLNINEFKSQCGDLNVQTDPEFSTAKVEGTYADGTEFSYDFCIQ